MLANCYRQSTVNSTFASSKSWAAPLYLPIFLVPLIIGGHPLHIVNPHYIQRFSIKPLAALKGNVRCHNQNGVLFSHKDYLTLVDTTGRIQRQDKRSFIPETFLPILQRLAIDADEWIVNTQNFEEVL